MDESNKFQELKNLKEQANKLWVRGVLEQQIDQERKKRLDSREQRRSSMGCEATYGPKETEETILFSQLKKLNDIDVTRKNLDMQVKDKQDDLQNR